MNKNEETLEIYKNIDDELYKEWDELYKLGAGYNLSPFWCRTWLKYFGNPDKVKIITIWEEQKLQLLAPFYSRKNQLVLTGTKPDLYDEFNVLYREKKYLEKLLAYIVKNKYQLNFRHLDAESEFSKELIKYISGKGLNQQSHVDETKLFIKNNFDPPGYFKRDVERCKRNINKDTGNEYVFEFKAPKTDELISEFVKYHTQRWDGGMLENNSAIIEFLKENLKDNDATILSRLYLSQTGETVGLGIGYLDSNNKFTYSMTAYNNKYRKYSPGKVFLYELINAVFENGINCFDMGRGSEQYKSWVTDKQSILFSIKTNNSTKYYKIHKFISKILDVIFY